MAEKMNVQASYISGRQFEARTGSGHRTIFDGNHEVGASPMEMLLACLATCSGISIISIVQKKQQVVTNYEVRVEGVRAETHPLVFTEITVEHILTGHSIRPEAVERAIELAETRYCGVSIMLGRSVKLMHTYKIIEA